MLQQQNRVIIVDDREDQLKELGEAFLKIGVGCRIFNFHDGIDAPLTGVRYAFFDINLLSESSQFVKIEVDESKDFEQIVNENSAVLNNLTVALNQYISIDNGPFILIFWTRNKHLIKYLEFYINQRGLDTPNPLRIDCFDKQELLGNETAILEKLQGLFNDETIRFPFAFENTVFKSAVKTTNQVFSLINQGTKWGDSTVYEKSSKQIFSKIAASTLGLKHAQEEPEKAINEGLTPLLSHEIHNSKNEVDWKSLLQPLYSVQKSSDIEIDSKTQGKLNTVFHIAKANDKKYLSHRGAVLDFYTYLKYKVDVGLNPHNYIFKIVEKKSNEVLNEFLYFKKGVLSSEKQACKTKCRFILVEVSPACDFANRNNRNYKFLLGLLFPNKNMNQVEVTKKANVFHQELPIVHLFDEEYKILFNLNFVFTSSTIEKYLGEPLFIFKKEIMDLIGNRYANHVSRIGITSF